MKETECLVDFLSGREIRDERPLSRLSLAAEAGRDAPDDGVCCRSLGLGLGLVE